jgi:hypothetical protein
MSFDLIFGKTQRDWSCGAVLALEDVKNPQALQDDLFARRDSKKLGSLVKAEIQKNFTTIVRLDTAKRLPVAERKAFGAFMRKWVDFNFKKNSQFAESDFVALMNFREANKRFTERLAVFDKVAQTPLKQPLVTTTTVVPFLPPGSQAPESPRPWGWLLGLGLGLAGLGFITTKLQ